MNKRLKTVFGVIILVWIELILFFHINSPLLRINFRDNFCVLRNSKEMQILKKLKCKMYSIN